MYPFSLGDLRDSNIVLSNYSQSFVFFFTVQLFKKVWLSVGLAMTTSGRTSVIMAFFAQVLEMVHASSSSSFSSSAFAH